MRDYDAHTPGPWSRNDWPQPDSSIAIGAAGTPLIAKVILRDVSINEQAANAALIAVAPKFLEALKRIAETPCNHGPQEFCPRELAQEAIAQMG